MTSRLIADKASSVLSPKRKSQFIAWFDGMTLTSDYPFLIKYVDQPTISFQNETLDQYNRKRIIKTRTQYDPINVRMHDDKQGRVRNFFINYAKRTDFSFEPKTEFDLNASVLDDYTQHGIVSKLTNEDDDILYEYGNLNIVTLDGNDIVQMISIQNPTLISFTFDALDYSDANPAEVALVFEYENVNFNEDVVNYDEKIQLLNLYLNNAASIGQFGEPV